MKAALAAIALVAPVLCAGALQAAPLAPSPLPINSDIVAIKDGCGIGFHRLSSGICRPEPKGPRLMRLFARKCPLGYRRNLAGKCRRD
ncbi:GCG_CRPN prefix-to-repeats domain-containing protein [Afipia clevelandensis]|uniref:Uncharacterized protein n=1 Tax=Afipia clevelandensis ATCC 49720 TaxID=883079 RepID=K8PDT7_9BRAD|nr:hypothetical protein [Afipia clevelandensis]EKS38909.1 hypothetical protein HMPREF9696_01378 [Afipia clevelandensis ATCC 49720]